MNSRTNPHNDGAQGVDPSAARSIVRAVEPPLLSPRALEDRRLIHRNDSTRLQADAFYLEGNTPAGDPAAWEPRVLKALAAQADPSGVQLAVRIECA